MRASAVSASRSAVVDRRVTVCIGDGALMREKLRVVHEEVDVCKQPPDRLVAGVCAREVVGDVRDRPGGVAHAKSECAPTLVRNVGGDDVEPLNSVITGFQAVEAPVAEQTLGTDRKMRGTHRARPSTSTGSVPS